MRTMTNRAFRASRTLMGRLHALGLAAAATALAPIAFAQTSPGAVRLPNPPPKLLQLACPAGQRLEPVWTPTGRVFNVNVPGSAGLLHSGVFVRPGFQYRMTAAGSIRVGVFGETGTPPDGWVPQGPAGDGKGFPDPSAYTFGLLFRKGGSAWDYVGAGPTVATLNSHDAPGSEVLFGINDNNLSDNTGVFIVTMAEYQQVTKCVTPTAPPQGGIYYTTGGTSASGSGTASSGQTSHGPCAGQTPNGQNLNFQARIYCSDSSLQYIIPVPACTNPLAQQDALAFAHSYGPSCAVYQVWQQ